MASNNRSAEQFLSLFIGTSSQAVVRLDGGKEIALPTSSVAELTGDHLAGLTTLAVKLVRNGCAYVVGCEIKGQDSDAADRLIAQLTASGHSDGAFTEKARSVRRLWLFLSDPTDLRSATAFLEESARAAGIIGEVAIFPCDPEELTTLPLNGGRKKLVDAAGHGRGVADIAAAKRTRISRTELAMLRHPQISERCWIGLLADYRGIVSDMEGVDAYDLFALMAAIGIGLGRRVFIQYAVRRIHPNFYLVLFGPTATPRKTSAARRAVDLIRQVDGQLRHVSALASAEGLLQILGGDPAVPQPPQRLIATLEEFYGLLKKARQDSVANLIPLLTELYDCPKDYQHPVRVKPLTAILPTISIIACTTPEWLDAGLKDDDIASGFANRWLYVSGPIRPPNAWPVAKHADMIRVSDQIRDILDHYSQDTEITLEKESRERWDRWYIEQYSADWPSASAGNMVQRTPEYVLKAALIYTAIQKRTTIDVDTLDRAIEAVTYAQSSMITLFEGLSLSVDAKLENRILKWLGEVGPLSVSQLHQKIGGATTAGQLRRALNNLAAIGRIKIDGKMVSLIED